MIKSTILLFLALCTVQQFAMAQDDNFNAAKVIIDFSDKIREWDGFGFNYVETAQTTDYDKDPQEYGGFSLLDEKEKQEIAELVFGENGLKVGIVKMFLDPWHQKERGGAFDHETTTRNMRDFVTRGVKLNRARGTELKIITTLYGPPPFMTKQKFLRGRDFDPAMKNALSEYFVDWAKYLRKNNFPVAHVSLHNEGEDWTRWPSDGKTGNIGEGHDYNMYWPTELVNEMILAIRKSLDKAGLKDVGVTNGETSNWFRFNNWGYAYGLYENKDALNALSIVTSHGFFHGNIGKRWYGDHGSKGIDLLREKRPSLKSWVTSTGWGKMDTYFVTEMQGSIYTAKVNAIIPWAGIQRPPKWVGGDPNAGSAFWVNEDGSYQVLPGYYFYKQVTRAGQPGMAVARASSMSSITTAIAFSKNGTRNPDAFVVINNSETWGQKIKVTLKGTTAKKFRAFRTTMGDGGDRYKDIGVFDVKDGAILDDLPESSVTTFFSVEDDPK